jgi:proline iminopeptidase
MRKVGAFLTGALFLVLVPAAGLCVAAQEAPSSDFQTITVKTSDGVKLHVEVAGEGTPCLFLHGGPGAASDWMRKLSNGLFEKHFRMIYLDQRGAGASTSPENGDYSMDRMVADFEEVREALGIKQWITMGHSFGGILQMGYVERHPDAVTGMVMLNCSLELNESIESSWIPKAVEILEIADPAPCYDKSVPLMKRIMPLIRQMQDKGVFWKLAYARKESEAVMDATNVGVAPRNHDLEQAAMSHEDYKKDFRPATAGVKAPVLFFYGRKDWMVGPEHYKGVKFPNMMLWGSDVGHFAVIEKRGDLHEAIAAYREKYAL